MWKKLAKVVALLVVLFGVACIAIPGLAMIPLYLIGGYTGLRMDSELLDSHQRAVNSFVESRGFGVERMRQRAFWNEYLVQLEGERFKVEKVQLIGLTEEYGDRYFDEAYPPKKEVLDEAVWRETTVNEDEAIYELRSGAALSRRISGGTEGVSDDGDVRVLAPIIAAADCLKCHDVDEGEIIGAFAYTLLPMGAVEADELPESESIEVPEARADPSAVPRAEFGL